MRDGPNYCGRISAHEPHDFLDWVALEPLHCAGKFPFSANPYLPHYRCDFQEPHSPHDWPHGDSYAYCEGREEPMDNRKEYSADNDPFNEGVSDETLHEGNQPVDVGTSRPPTPDEIEAEERSLRLLWGAVEADIHEEARLKWHDPDAVPAYELNSPQNVSGRKEVIRWADRAMFKAEPIDADAGPKVYLLWMTPDPLGAIAAACKMYKGEVVRDLATVTDQERLEYFAQVQKTKLKAPFEFVQFHFMIEGVTRAFTHQMVRQRTAVYAQESLRFAVLGGADTGIPVSLPPSLSGLAADDVRVQQWTQALGEVESAYLSLVENGVPAEDARGLLPQNTLTRLHYSTNLRALLDHAGNRLCTQAQFEWRLVFARIIESIRNVDYKPKGGNVLELKTGNGMQWVYMAAELTDLFKPVCYQTGKCEFKANFDRACSIRDRVDANEQTGRPSSEWDQLYGSSDIEEGGIRIMPIKPGEWLLDPSAARRK